MPSTLHLFSVLSDISNQWKSLAVFWHLYFAALAFTLIAGIRLQKRVAGILLVPPLLSVSFLFWLNGNPFSGVMFALASVALIIVAVRLPKEPVRISSLSILVPGVLLFAFGWVYPSFLNAESFIEYLYFAPTGLIPCPTLSIVIGISLILGGLNSQAWSAIIGIMGFLYGSLGAVRFSVTIDWFLFIGSVLILFVAFTPQRFNRTYAN